MYGSVRTVRTVRYGRARSPDKPIVQLRKGKTNSSFRYFSDLSIKNLHRSYWWSKSQFHKPSKLYFTFDNNGYFCLKSTRPKLCDIIMHLKYFDILTHSNVLFFEFFTISELTNIRHENWICVIVSDDPLPLNYLILYICSLWSYLCYQEAK